MWAWFVLFGNFCLGYSVAAAVFGLSGRSSAVRVGAAVALGAAGVMLLASVLLIFALSGGLPRAASIPSGVWAGAAGVALASARALFVARGNIRQWVAGGGIRKGMLSAAGAAVALVIGLSLSLAMSPKKEAAAVPAERLDEKAAVEALAVVPGAACECAAGGVCLASAAAWWGAGYAGSGSQYEPAVVGSEISNNAAIASENPECACAARAWCEGSRGGRYCLTDAGARRYVKAEK